MQAKSPYAIMQKPGGRGAARTQARDSSMSLIRACSDKAGKRVRIGLDARSIFMPRPRGTGRNLNDAYRLLTGMRPEWEFVFYHQRAAGRSDELWGRNTRLRRMDMPGDRFDWWRQIRLPAAAWMDGVELLHLPANTAPAWCPVPYVATIHDLIPLRADEGLTPEETAVFERGVRRAARGAVHIICPSRATSDELAERYGVAHERMSVIPWAADRGIVRSAGGSEKMANTEATVQAEIERVRAAYRMAGPWLVNFSGSSPRKNATGLIEGFARIPEKERRGVTLVLVGCEPASFRTRLEGLRDRAGLGDSCRLYGFVPHEDLSGLLRGARGMVMPSLCEGFGLPILDAFACDTPVLTSNLSSMPEAAGRAAVYCDPSDPQSIANGVVKLLDDGRADRLRRAGRSRLKEFSWSRTAGLMCEVFERCLTWSARRGGRVGAKIQACGGGA